MVRKKLTANKIPSPLQGKESRRRRGSPGRAGRREEIDLAQPSRATGGMDSIPALLQRNATEFAGRDAYREKEYGIWQTMDLGRGRARDRGAGARAHQSRGRCRRLDRRHRAQPALFLLGHGRGAVGGRDPRPALPGRRGRRDGLCHGSLRGPLRHRPGSGAGRQAHRGAGGACTSSSTSSMSTRAACANTTTTSCTASPTSRSRGAPPITSSSRISRRAARRLDYDSTCVMLYTSGTTGKPKGVVLSNRNIIEASRSSAEFDI